MSQVTHRHSCWERFSARTLHFLLLSSSAPHLSSVPKLLPCCYCRLHFSLKNSFAFGCDFLSTRCSRARLSESAVPQGELSAVPGASYQWLSPHKAEPSRVSKHISRYEERKELAASGMYALEHMLPTSVSLTPLLLKPRKFRTSSYVCICNFQNALIV